MKLSRYFATLPVVFAVACSSNPAGPSANGTSLQNASANGNVSAEAITMERMRLRVVGGNDLQTNLATGQIIAVPRNVNLDIWAEIRRLESDRARLTVDWGTGYSDFTGCGSCRLENTYRLPGRFTVVAKVTDLNGPLDAPPILSATFSVDVQ